MPFAQAVQVGVGDQHVYAIARSEAVAFNAGALHDSVIVALGHGGVAGHSAWIKIIIVPDSLNGDFFGLSETAANGSKQNCYKK